MVRIRNRVGSRLVGAGVVCVGLTAGVAFAAEPGPAAQAADEAVASSRPAATRPADSRVLVRLGDREAITQADFEASCRGSRPVPFEVARDGLLRELVELRYFLLYLADHPDLAPEKDIDREINKIKQREHLNTPEDVQKWLKRLNLTPEVWRQRWQILLAKGALIRRGQELAKDEAALRKRFESDPAEFNGTEVTARHIQISVLPFETAQERKAKREKAEQIRRDLVSGKRTWAEAVRESDCGTRTVGGELGTFTRHFKLMEALTAQVFKLDVQKISDVIETPLGYHIVEVTRRIPGTRTFEDAKREMKLWVEQEQYIKAIDEVRKKYPVIGVQAPLPPPAPESSETRPAETRPGA